MFCTGGFAVALDRAVETAWWDAFCDAWFFNTEDHAIAIGAIDSNAPQYVEGVE